MGTQTPFRGKSQCLASVGMHGLFLAQQVSCLCRVAGKKFFKGSAIPCEFGGEEEEGRKGTGRGGVCSPLGA